jgi:hypothetical protein
MNLNHGLFLTCIVCLLGGCSQFEQYPHPYIAHSKIPFTQQAPADHSLCLPSHPRIAVVELQSQVVSPVGAYFVEDHLERPIVLDVDVSTMAEQIRRDLGGYGADVVHVADMGQSQRIDSGMRSKGGGILRGTVLDMEFSQHGLKKSPYDFLYITIRFTVERANDGQRVWQGDVTVYQKIVPGPETTQKSVAADAIHVATRELADNDSFRSALDQTQKGT